MAHAINTRAQADVYCSDNGFWFNWGPQAWFDYFAVKIMHKRMHPVVPQTFLPIIQLSCDDKDAALAAWQHLLDYEDEKPVFSDSPRQKWRKIYGNLTREMEWGITEIYRYIPPATANNVLVDALARHIGGAGDGMIKLLEWSIARMTAKIIAPEDVEKENEKKLKLSNRIFKAFNFMYFIVGDVEITDWDVAGGSMTIEVSDCAFLRAGRLEKIPENGCLQFCKGSCEKLFGNDAPIKMEFDPHLPETGCTIRASWKHRDNLIAASAA
jgi:hypothetical protein